VRTVTEVTADHLCIGCGLCQAVCPTHAIVSKPSSTGMTYPQLDASACIQCGDCYRVCPGRQLEARPADAHGVTTHDLHLGAVEGCFTVDANKQFKVRHTPSSGFVSALLSYLLDTEAVDGALVVKPRDEQPTRGHSLIAKSKAEVLQCAGSLYYPVSIQEGITYILEHAGRYAIVGMPCQIRGIDNLRQLRPKIADRFAVTIGLFCGFMPGYLALDYLLHRLGIAVSDRRGLRRIGFLARRGSEQGLLVETAEGESFMPRREYASLISAMFSEERCLVCDNMTNELADFSCGDARRLAEGQSLVLTRKTWCLDILSEGEDAGYWRRKVISPQQASYTQQMMLSYKKETIKARVTIMQHLRRCRTLQLRRSTLSRGRPYQWMGALLYILNALFTRTRWGRYVVFQVPPGVIRLYNQFVTALLTGGPSNGERKLFGESHVSSRNNQHDRQKKRSCFRVS